ncbi:MAG: peptide deformylase [Candidatus Moranbacteria bacterium]|nr:peptide deformylase [Candidatus Moranbacteria bacterium]MBP9801716.1 peptide deformylase [Candidatus Moranbacteria bacterium]
MNTLTLVTGANTDVLNRKAFPVALPFPDEIYSLLDEMVITMRKEKGIGLAAPQVGISQRICVIEIDGTVTKYLNPEITTRSQEKIFFEEGCLSLPGEFFPIERHEEITVKYWNEKGLPKRIRTRGLLAIVLQHEIDHLDGILICKRYQRQKSKEGKIYGRIVE